MSSSNTALQDHYATLNISPTADPDTIKKAYRALALEYHPDKASPDEQQEATSAFQKINNAFKILSSTDTRNTFNIARQSATTATAQNTATRKQRREEEREYERAKARAWQRAKERDDRRARDHEYHESYRAAQDRMREKAREEEEEEAKHREILKRAGIDPDSTDDDSPTMTSNMRVVWYLLIAITDILTALYHLTVAVFRALHAISMAILRVACGYREYLIERVQFCCEVAMMSLILAFILYVLYMVLALFERVKAGPWPRAADF